MNTLKVEELTNETFCEYGSFSDMLHPTGTFLGGIPPASSATASSPTMTRRASSPSA